MENNTKRRLVDEAYELLKVIHLEKLTAQAISQKAGCTADVVFKYFPSLDQLIRVAAVRILDSYSQDSQEAISDASDTLDLDARLWAIFLPYTFQYLDVFEHLFWIWDREDVQEAYDIYYSLYPEKRETLNEGFTDVFLGTDLRARSIVVLKRAADEGLIYPQDVQVMANLSVGLLHTMINSYRGVYRSTAMPYAVSTEFLTALKSLHDHYRLK